MHCDQIMTRRPYFLRQDQPASEAAAQMRRQNVALLPVCDAENKVIGALTDRDIVLRLVADGGSTHTQVGELMSPEVLVCRTDDEAEVAQAMLREHEVSRLVCLDAHGKLAGMVSMAELTAPQQMPARPRPPQARAHD